MHTSPVVITNNTKRQPNHWNIVNVEIISKGTWNNCMHYIWQINAKENIKIHIDFSKIKLVVPCDFGNNLHIYDVIPIWGFLCSPVII